MPKRNSSTSWNLDSVRRKGVLPFVLLHNVARGFYVARPCLRFFEHWESCPSVALVSFPFVGVLTGGCGTVQQWRWVEGGLGMGDCGGYLNSVSPAKDGLRPFSIVDKDPSATFFLFGVHGADLSQEFVDN